jgi:hypothetical protein
VIEVAGECWGTAKEIADHIGQGLTEGAVYWWGRGKGLAKVRTTDDDGRPQVRYSLRQAIEIDMRVRAEGRGRKRAA